MPVYVGAFVSSVVVFIPSELVMSAPTRVSVVNSPFFPACSRSVVTVHACLCWFAVPCPWFGLLPPFFYIYTGGLSAFYMYMIDCVFYMIDCVRI